MAVGRAVRHGPRPDRRTVSAPGTMGAVNANRLRWGALAWVLTLQFFVVETIAQLRFGAPTPGSTTSSATWAPPVRRRRQLMNASFVAQGALILAGALLLRPGSRRGAGRVAPVLLGAAAPACCWSASSRATATRAARDRRGAVPGRRRPRADRAGLRPAPAVRGARDAPWRCSVSSGTARRCSSSRASPATSARAAPSGRRPTCCRSGSPWPGPHCGGSAPRRRGRRTEPAGGAGPARAEQAERERARDEALAAAVRRPTTARRRRPASDDDPWAAPRAPRTDSRPAAAGGSRRHEAEHLTDRPAAADPPPALGRVAHAQQHLRMPDEGQPCLQAGPGGRPVERLRQRRGRQPSAVACRRTRPSAWPARSQATRSSSSVPMSTTVGPLHLRGRRVGVPAGEEAVLVPLADDEVADQPVRGPGVRVAARHGLHGHAVDGGGIGAQPALQLGTVGGVALLDLLGAGDQEDRGHLLLRSGDRLEPGAERAGLRLEAVEELGRHRPRLERRPAPCAGGRSRRPARGPVR